MKLTPGSLRAGGATHLLESGTPVATIRFQGGWAGKKSLASYLQEAESAATLLDLSEDQARQLERVLHEFSFLSEPPGVPFALFGNAAARR